jgi:hypothetical protein
MGVGINFQDARNGVEVFSSNGGPGSIAGSVVLMVNSGPGCAQYQAVTGNGVRANTGTVGHFQKVIGITKTALAAGVAATLDCGTLAAGNEDSVLAAGTAGVAGNAIRVALTGDSPPAGGVTITNAGNDYTIHYETLVSTVLDVETAIGLLAGTPFVVSVVGTPGTVLNNATDNFALTALAGGADGAAGQVVTDGKIKNAAWTWTPGAPIYLNANVLSETDPVIAPGAGFNQQIGIAVETGTATSDTIDVKVGTPILA